MPKHCSFKGVHYVCILYGSDESTKQQSRAVNKNLVAKLSKFFNYTITLCIIIVVYVIVVCI